MQSRPVGRARPVSGRVEGATATETKRRLPWPLTFGGLLRAGGPGMALLAHGIGQAAAGQVAPVTVSVIRARRPSGRRAACQTRPAGMRLHLSLPANRRCPHRACVSLTPGHSLGPVLGLPVVHIRRAATDRHPRANKALTALCSEGEMVKVSEVFGFTRSSCR